MSSQADEEKQTEDVTGTDQDQQQQPEPQQEPQPEPLPLDWTQLGVGADEAMPLRYPHDVAELNDQDLDIYIVGTAGQKITVLGNDFSDKCNPNLETLVIRSHLIQKLQGLEKFTKLKTMEFYDNQIQKLECLEGPGPNITVLDISYNVIRDLSPVSICTNLTELYIANNKLHNIKGLGALVHLRKVDLGANRIREMDGEELSGLVNLEELWMGKNKITRIQGLEKLTKLRRLDVQSNRLTQIENLAAQVECLEELYLAHNGIDDAGASMESGLAMKFPNLNVLDLGRNRLTSTAPFAHLTGLEELWISGNQIETFDAVLPLKEAAMEGTQKLETIYLEYNPVASDFEYRKRLKEWIPSLSQIDADLIGGLVAHGLPGVAHTAMGGGPQKEQMRLLQQAAIERAKKETEAKQQHNNQQS